MEPLTFQYLWIGNDWCMDGNQYYTNILGRNVSIVSIIFVISELILSNMLIRFSISGIVTRLFSIMIIVVASMNRQNP